MPNKWAISVLKVILVTPSDQIEGEIERVISLLEEGLEILHLRKPKSSKVYLENYIKAIPSKFHNRIIIHGHYDLALKFNLKGVNFQREHRTKTWKNKWRIFKLRLRNPKLVITTTFKRLESLQSDSLKFDYVILNPVFTAKAYYAENEESGINVLSNAIISSKQTVFAMGGINAGNINVVKKAGFAGMAFCEELFDQKASLLKVLTSAA